MVLYGTDRRVLLLRRCRPAGYWQSVTGSLEWGESPLAAAQRELAEEIGAKEATGLRDWQHCTRFPIVAPWSERYHPDHRINTEHLFSLVLPAGYQPRINPAEHDSWQWISSQEAIRRAGSASNRAAILLLARDGLV